MWRGDGKGSKNRVKGNLICVRRGDGGGARIESGGIQPVRKKEMDKGGKLGGHMQRGEGWGRKAYGLRVDRRRMGEENLEM